jgi:hypothetical protein
MDVMVALVGALTSIVSYASQASEATVKSARPEVDRLVRALEMSVGSGHFRRPYSRYEVAVFIYAAVATAEEAIQTFERESPEVARDGWSRKGAAHGESMAQAMRRLRAFRANQGTLQRLATSFRTELRELGVDVEAFPGKIASLSDRSSHLHPPLPGEAFLPFPDVPQGHWAYDAVQRLRKERILRGYPNGRYGG